jgi:chromosome partitioning protein
LATAAGLAPTELQRTSGSAKSGYAISLSQDGKRTAQRKYVMQFRDADERLVAISATLYNRAMGTQFPEGGYSVHYREIPLSPEELASAREDMDELSYLQEYEASFVTFQGRAYYGFTDANTLPVRQLYNPDAPLLITFDFNVAPGVAAVALSQLSGWRLGAEIDRLRKLHDVLIVDSPPQIDTDAKLAIRAADLVLVPLQPSPPDLWAAEGTLKLAGEEKRRARLVFNRAPAGGSLRASVEAEIAAQGHPMLAATLGNRVGFAGAFAKGLGVTETAPRSTAAQEMRAVLAELEGLLP